jgi:hypothetical protein
MRGTFAKYKGMVFNLTILLQKSFSVTLMRHFKVSLLFDQPRKDYFLYLIDTNQFNPVFN